jgi:hypothetical protein
MLWRSPSLHDRAHNISKAYGAAWLSQKRQTHFVVELANRESATNWKEFLRSLISAVLQEFTRSFWPTTSDPLLAELDAHKFRTGKTPALITLRDRSTAIVFTEDGPAAEGDFNRSSGYPDSALRLICRPKGFRAGALGPWRGTSRFLRPPSTAFCERINCSLIGCGALPLVQIPNLERSCSRWWPFT